MFGFIRSRNFKRLLISYLIILIIPLVISGLLYVQITGIMREDTIDTNTAILQNASDAIETRLVELEHMANEFNLNNHVQYLLTAAKGVGDDSICTLVEVHDNLPHFSFDNELIDGYYLYFINSDIIITANTTYLKPRQSYDEFFKMENMDYEDWKRVLNTRYESTVLPSQSIVFERSLKQRNIFIQSLYGAQTGTYVYNRIYLLGSEAGRGNLVITYSRDQGVTWEPPGVLMEGRFWNTPAKPCAATICTGAWARPTPTETGIPGTPARRSWR